MAAATGTCEKMGIGAGVSSCLVRLEHDGLELNRVAVSASITISCPGRGAAPLQRCTAGPGPKIAKTTPCKVEWARLGSTRALPEARPAHLIDRSALVRPPRTSP